MRIKWSAVFAAAFAMVFATQANADNQSVAERLARAAAANQRCNILIAAEAIELNALQKRAEVRANDVAALAKARNTGGRVKCDEVTQRNVKAVLSNSRHLALPQVLPNAPPKETVQVPAEQSAAAVPIKQKAVDKSSKPKPIKSVKRKPPSSTRIAAKPATGNLARYASMAEAYYRELRCRNLSRSGVLAFYQDVRRNHHQAVATYGAGKVSSIIRTAASRARRGNC